MRSDGWLYSDYRAVSLSVRNVIWGCGWGLFVGCAFLAMAAAIIWIQGGLPEPAPPLALVLMIYPAGALAGGAIVGLLRSRITTRTRALVVAPFAIFLTTMGILVLAEGMPVLWNGSDWFAVITGSIILGVMGGHHMWKASLYQPRPRAVATLRARRRRG